MVWPRQRQLGGLRRWFDPRGTAPRAVGPGLHTSACVALCRRRSPYLGGVLPSRRATSPHVDPPTPRNPEPRQETLATAAELPKRNAGARPEIAKSPQGGGLSLNRVFWAQSMPFASQVAQVRGRARDVVAVQGIVEWYKSDNSVKEEKMELRT
jgi:hypothetical protein